MSTGFTKLFSSITDSTIWCESTSVRIVWITMLAMADRDGNIAASIPGLATRARVTVPECEEALTKFLSPDKYSRTPDHEGRRIEVIHGGWRLLNYNYYRNLQDRETVLERKRRWWNENKGANKTPLDAARQTRPDLTQAEAEAEAEADKTLKTKPTPPSVTLPAWIPEEAWKGYVEMRKKIRAPMTERATKLTFAKLLVFKEQGFDVGAILDESTQKDWRGVFAPRAEGQSPKAPEMQWWRSNQGIEAKARETGCWPARGGESYQDLAQRVRVKLEAANV